MNTFVNAVYIRTEISYSRQDEGSFHTGSGTMKFDMLASERSKLQVAKYGVTRLTQPRTLLKSTAKEHRSVHTGAQSLTGEWEVKDARHGVSTDGSESDHWY